MRIIAGKHRGRVLAEFKGTDIRPTADRVKESLFNMLSVRLYGARVLDLFCGSGALGLECISRGADEVVFNDISRESLALLKKNLALLREEGTVYNYDYKVCLQRVSGTFRFIFADPPYAQENLGEILRIVRERNLLEEDGAVIYESEEKVSSPFDGWELYDERNYGRTYLAFFRRKE